MIYITGDTHGDLDCFADKKLKKLKSDDTLIICGDFGFLWDNSSEEEEKLEYLKKCKYNILFVDGTHENFDILEKMPVVKFGGADAHKIADNIYHLMRGKIYIIESKGIFTFGGGISHDIETLIDSNIWYERETPTEEEMEQGVLELKRFGCKLDYVITHEPPARIKKFLNPNRQINDTNIYLDHMIDEITYEKWFFGNMHIDEKIDDNMFAVFNDILPVSKVKKARNF